MVEPDKLAERLAAEIHKHPARARELIERALKQALHDELLHWQKVTGSFASVPELIGVSRQIDQRRRGLA